MSVHETFDSLEDTGDKLSNVMSLPRGVLITLNILVTCLASTKGVKKKFSKTIVLSGWTIIIVPWDVFSFLHYFYHFFVNGMKKYCEDHISDRWYFSLKHLSSCHLHLLCKTSEILYPEQQFTCIKLNRFKAWLLFFGRLEIIPSQIQEDIYLGKACLLLLFFVCLFLLVIGEGIKGIYIYIYKILSKYLFNRWQDCLFFIRSGKSCMISFFPCKAQV